MNLVFVLSCVPDGFFHIFVPLELAAFAFEGAAAARTAAGSANNGASLFHFLAEFRDSQDHAGGQHADGVVGITSGAGFGVHGYYSAKAILPVM